MSRVPDDSFRRIQLDGVGDMTLIVSRDMLGLSIKDREFICSLLKQMEEYDLSKEKA